MSEHLSNRLHPISIAVTYSTENATIQMWTHVKESENVGRKTGQHAQMEYYPFAKSIFIIWLWGDWILFFLLIINLVGRSREFR